MKKKLLILALILLSFVANATTIVVGSGSGSLSAISATPIGDTLGIMHGTYSGGDIENQVGIVIVPYGGDVTFVGNVTYGNNNYTKVECLFNGYQLSLNGVSGDGITFIGNNIRGMQWDHLIAINVTGIVLQASGYYQTYNGDTSTLKLYKAYFTNCKFTSCQQIFQGSYNTASFLNQSIIDSMVVAYDSCYNITDNGNGWNGVVTRFDCHNNLVVYNIGQNYQVNDVGYFSFTGYGKCYNNIINGGRGWLIRNFLCALTSSPGDTYIYNNIKYRTTNYGLVDVRCDSTMYSTYYTKSNFHIFNNTMANCIDTAYLAPIAVIYQMDAGAQGDVKNNFGTNLKLGSGNWLTSSFGDAGGNFMWNTDTANNIYALASAASTYLQDTSVTFMPTSGSYLNTHGSVEALAIPDIYGYNGSNNRIGAVFYNSGIAPPVANAGSNQSVTLPTSSVTLNGTASTGTISSYSWYEVSGPNTATLGSPTSVTTTASSLIQGSYVFELVLNGGGTSSDSASVTITVNAAIVANAGSNQNITLPTSSASLSASGSTGAITSYTWSQTSGPSTATITPTNTVSTTVSSLVDTGNYVFQVSVNGGVSTSSVTVHVSAAPIVKPCNCAAGTASVIKTVRLSSPPLLGSKRKNKLVSLPACIPPVVSPGSNQTITLSQGSITLSGSAKGVNGSGIASYFWSVSPNTGVTIRVPSNPSTLVSFLDTGTFVFTLTAVDTCGQPGSKTVTIRVNPNPATSVIVSPNTVPGSKNIIGVLSTSFTGLVALHVYNTSGYLLSTYTFTKSTTNNISFSIPSKSGSNYLGTGTYTLQAVTGSIRVQTTFTIKW